MKMRLVLPTALSFALLVTPIVAHADTLIFNLTGIYGNTERSAESGPAQGVIASTTTTISSFSFYLDAATSEDLNFFITDGTGTTLLYSGTETITPGTETWVESPTLSFTLTAGSEYYFGVVGDGSNTEIGYIFPPAAYSANGLSADPVGNANTTGPYATPTPLSLDSGLAEIGLELFAPSNVATTPEPSSLILLGTGAVGMFGAARRRFVRK